MSHGVVMYNIVQTQLRKILACCDSRLDLHSFISLVLHVQGRSRLAADQTHIAILLVTYSLVVCTVPSCNKTAAFVAWTISRAKSCEQNTSGAKMLA